MRELVRYGMIRTHYYIHRVFRVDGENLTTVGYVWHLSGGQESTEFFKTMDEAEQDIRSRYEV